MNRKEVLEELNVLFRDVLDNDSISLNEETTANDIEEWDSLAHVQLFDAIQKRFQVKISAREMLSWKNIGEMLDGLMDKMK